MANSIKKWSVSTYYKNVRGLNSKVDIFYPKVSDCDYKIIAINETWLKCDVNSSELFPDNYEETEFDVVKVSYWQMTISSNPKLLIFLDLKKIFQ